MMILTEYVRLLQHCVTAT